MGTRGGRQSFSADGEALPWSERGCVAWRLAGSATRTYNLKWTLRRVASGTVNRRPLSPLPREWETAQEAGRGLITERRRCGYLEELPIPGSVSLVMFPLVERMNRREPQTLVPKDNRSPSGEMWTHEQGGADLGEKG